MDMKIIGDLKNRCLILGSMTLGILAFSNVQAQDSTAYQSNTTVQTTTSTSTDDTYSSDRRTGFAGPKAGIKAGLNYSNLIVDNVDDKAAKWGLNAGIFVQLFASETFAIQPELLYSSKGNEVRYTAGVLQQENKFNLHYLDIPILAVFKLGRAAELQVGPYWSYLLGANIDTDGDVADGFREVDRDNFDKWDYGLVGGLGFNLGDNVQLGARYNYGLNEIGRSPGAKTLLGNTRNSVGQIYLAFNLSSNTAD
jgi:hypothetical protein